VGEVAADGALTAPELLADASGGHGGVAVAEPGDRSGGANISTVTAGMKNDTSYYINPSGQRICSED